MAPDTPDSAWSWQLQSHRLWIIDYDAFGFGWLCSTQRLFAESRALQPRGWHTTLFLARKPVFKRHHSIERAFPGAIAQLPFPEDACPKAWNHAYLRTFWIRTHPRSERYLVDDPELYFTPRMERWTERQAARAGRPDVIWGVSYGALRSAVVARRMSEQLQVPLIVAFHDPCPPRDQELTPAQTAALERTLQRASAIVTATSTYADELRGLYPYARDRVHVVYPTTPPAAPQAHAGGAVGNERIGAALTLLHPGTLSGGSQRSANSLVAALPLLFERRPEAEGKVKLRLIGLGPGLAEAAAESRRLSVAEAVSAEGPMPPDKIWQEMVRADCLVLIKASGAEFDAQVPGKLFPMLAAERPVLALVHEGETATIARRSGLGLIAPPDDPIAIADRLVDLWDAKMEGRSIVAPAHSYISQFSEDKIGDQLRQLLDEAIG